MKLKTSKKLSSPTNPAQAVLEGLKELLVSSSLREEDHVSHYVITHGSTVATNALLERKGSRTGLITTKGFGDVIEIGRQDRPAIYDLAVQPPQHLIPKQLRFEINERVDHRGEILVKLNKQELAALVSQIDAEPVDSIAVCLLFSFLDPEHEQMIANEVR